MKSVFITGCSSGFGLETARYFLERDWRVVATMRTPRAGLLPKSDRLCVLALDVTSPATIERAVEEAGTIDVLVNNAGIGLLSPFEGTSMDAIRAVFDANTFGTFAVTAALLPRMRDHGTGVIVNVTSAVTLRPLPLLAVYTASKAAVTAWSESLALEVKDFGVRVRLVVPGRSPETSFGDNAHRQEPPAAYESLVQNVRTRMTQVPVTEVTHASDVAEAIWSAANDASSPMRTVAGADARAWAAA